MAETVRDLGRRLRDAATGPAWNVSRQAGAAFLVESLLRTPSLPPKLIQRRRGQNGGPEVAQLVVFVYYQVAIRIPDALAAAAVGANIAYDRAGSAHGVFPLEKQHHLLPQQARRLPRVAGSR